MSFVLHSLLRADFDALQSLATADDIDIKINLSKNENRLGSPLLQWYNTYPNNQYKEVKKAIAEIKKVQPENILLSNSQQNLLSACIKTFCTPKQDNIVVCTPADTMVAFAAQVHWVALRSVPLLPDGQLPLEALEQSINQHTKILVLASPNTETGIKLDRQSIEMVLNNFHGIVLIDEAYINFSTQKSFLQELQEYPQLVVMQTFSKAWGLAGLRVATLFASPEIIRCLSVVAEPYPLAQPTAKLLLQALEQVEQVNDMIREIISLRDALIPVLASMPFVEKVWQTEANFVVLKVSEPLLLKNFLQTKGIAVHLLKDEGAFLHTLRITIGTEQECTQLVDAFVEWIEKI